MQEIIINLFIAAFEIIIIHMLFAEIFEKRQGLEKVIFPVSLLFAGAIFMIEMIGRGTAIVYIELAVVLAYANMFFTGNKYKKIFYVVIYALIYLSGHLTIDYIHNVNETGTSANGNLGWSIETDILFVKIITFLIALFIIYLHRKNNSDYYGEMFKMFLVFPAATIVLLSAIYQSDIYEYGVSKKSGLLLIGIILLIISNVVVQNMFEKYADMKHSEEKARFKEMQGHMEKRYYENMEKSNREYIELMHNIKQHFSVIRSMADENHQIKEYLNSIDVKMKSVSKVIYTENNIFNAILSDKKNEADSKGIACYIRVDRDVVVGSISNMELIEIVGNILDNAIEASEKLNIKEKREIHIRSYMSQGGRFFVFNVENLYDREPDLINGKYVSSKKDKSRHGIGLKTVKDIADRNGGYVSIEAENNTFSISVFLPCQNKTK